MGHDGGFRHSVYHRILRAAASDPQTPAVTDAVTTLDFGHLLSRVNRLGWLLRQRGVAAEDVIGVWGRRSADLIVAMLGVVAAGGAYLPLDPGHPPARLRWMLRDTDARLLVSPGEVPVALGEGIEVVRLDDETVLDGMPDTPHPVPEPDRLGYVMYTSGSTGQPKGVMVTHASLVSYLDWAVRAYQVEAGSGAPVHSSIAFDMSVTSVLAPLTVGRRVHLLPEAPGIEALAGALAGRIDYSLVKLTPAHLVLLADELDDADPVTWAGQLVIGGEQLTGEHLEAWRRFAPGSIITNEYGPTETVVGCCAYQIPVAEAPASGPVPIGVPIDGVDLLVLDDHLSPVPDGEIGELFIGGRTVARGYWRQPARTAERFLPHPTVPGARMYRTGDLVCRGPDGTHRFVGRVDTQVKLHGHRIELGGVESTLREHPAVQDAVVMLEGGQRTLLKAYLQPAVARDAVALTTDPGGVPVVVPRVNPTEPDAGVGPDLEMPIRDGATVLDHGAGAGLFSLAVARQVRGVRVIAVEPAPPYEAPLGVNLGLHLPGSVVLTSGPVTVSTVIDRFDLPEIDLLRIDLARAGADAVDGVSETHWPRIRQVLVTGVQDPGHHAELLRDHGFQVDDFGGRLRGHRPDHRNSGAPAVRPPRWRPFQGIRQWLVARLPQHEIPTRIELVARFPLTANGKVDRRALRNRPL
jgi:amino acid adenylation domain-containing protein